MATLGPSLWSANDPGSLTGADFCSGPSAGIGSGMPTDSLDGIECAGVDGGMEEEEEGGGSDMAAGDEDEISVSPFSWGPPSPSSVLRAVFKICEKENQDMTCKNLDQGEAQSLQYLF